MFGLPVDVRFCTRCVISNQRPSSTVEFRHAPNDQKSTIGFDSQGICDACRYHEIKEKNIDWKRREEMLLETLAKFRRKDSYYNVIVPGSGGKDSAFTSHVLKYKYGMNPLTVTWAPHLYTEIGWKNFERWIHIGGHDNLLFTPNGRLHRHLTRLAFLNLLHPFQPFIVGQRIIGPAVARRFGIKLVMYGENQAEYGNDPKDNKRPLMDRKFFSGDNPLEMVLGGIKVKEIISQTSFHLEDFAPYIPPSNFEIEQCGIEVHYLGYYLKWDPQECYYYAAENTGFTPNTERTEGSYSKYSSIDDRIDPFHYYTTLIKFGIGRATYDASQEIRNNKINREEAVKLVHKYDEEFPKKYFADFLKYIDISEETFFKTLDNFRPTHLWAKNKNDWILKHKVQ